ncbi:MAG TPA: homocysteine S-methyltransferase [Candidatus Limnocylindrales bacterium]
MDDRRQAPSPLDPLGALLAGGRSVVLDGGLATELEADGADLSDALWSARLLVEDPDAIVRAHLAFFRAGAQIAITASYQATFEGFARRGIDRNAAVGLMRRSVRLAQDARAVALAERGTAGERPLLVAASIGPYGAFLADGSEYRGDYGLAVPALRDFHRERMAALLAAGPDLLACETIPEIDEGRALVDLLAELGGAGWLSFSCADGARLRSGAPVEEAFALADGSPGVVAIGINCTAPEYALELVGRAVAVTGKPVVVYPNSGEAWDPAGRRWVAARVGAQAAGGTNATVATRAAVGSADADAVGAVSARAWIAAGARLVGGCCRVGPAQIAEIADAVDRAA